MEERGSTERHMYNVMILRILSKYTDGDHHLNQVGIQQKLKEEFDVEIDRRSVKKNLDFLMDFGEDIEEFPDGYAMLSHVFEDSELHLLIDSVLFSRAISQSQAKQLIQKLQDQGNVYFQSKVSHIANLQEMQYSDNRQVLYSVDTINDAIEHNHKITFIHNRYDTDFRLHPSANNPHVASPFQMVANNGRYYLLAHDENHDSVGYFRIDRMTEVKELSDKRIKLRTLKGFEHGLDLPKHMAEHLYMYSGESVPASLRIRRQMFGDLIDWFGKDISVLKEEGDEVTVRVTCNEQSLFFWALQYGMNVEVLSPASLRNKIRDALQTMIAKYDEGEGR